MHRNRCIAEYVLEFIRNTLMKMYSSDFGLAGNVDSALFFRSISIVLNHCKFRIAVQIGATKKKQEKNSTNFGISNTFYSFSKLFAKSLNF